LDVSKFRSLLLPLTAGWLSVHLLAMTGTAIIAFASGSHSDIVCTCAHGADHGSCPMHRTPTDAAECRLQGTQDDLATALMSVLGPLALPATAGVPIVDTPSPGLVGWALALPSDWIVPPEPPPPRS
jgi:hypothetical protein